MAVGDSYREFVLEQLGRVRPVTWRKMFGGIGVSAEGAFFALLAHDMLYFKTNDANRPDFEARGLKPFQPFGPGTKPMGYYEVPADVLENVAKLTVWLAKAVAVAKVSKTRSRAPRKPTRPSPETRRRAA